jgi:heptosyltransferase-2
MFDFLTTLTARLFLKSSTGRRRVLVVQEGKIGDLVCTTPLFRTLKNNFAEPVDVVAGTFAEEVLKGNDAVGEILPRTVSIRILRQKQYSHVLILMPSVEILKRCVVAGIPNLLGTVHDKMSKKEKLYSFFLTKKFNYDFVTAAQDHYLEMAKALGVTNPVRRREVYFDAQDRVVADQFLNQYGLQGKKLAGISVTAGKDFKEWGIENFAHLVNRLNESGFCVIGVGSLPEREKLEKLALSVDRGMFFNTAGLFSLSQLAALVSIFSVFVSADTGPLYIADALAVPVVDLMGPCCSTSQRPQGAKAVIVGECQEPVHPKCYMMNCPNALREDFSRCMRDITFAEVWKGLEYVH